MLETEQTFSDAFNPKMWAQRASGGGEGKEYSSLSWVKNPDLLAIIPGLLKLVGDETVLDMATGSGVVAKEISPHVSRVISSDISLSMLKLMKDKPANVSLSVIDSTKSFPFPDESVDAVTARMVFHHLSIEDIEKALNESLRVLKPGGKLLAIEYVPPTEFSRGFEKHVFDIKEKGRQLWTAEDFSSLIKSLGMKSDFKIDVHSEQAIMRAYSVHDWLSKSGLSLAEQQSIQQLYFNAPGQVIKEMNIQYVRNGKLQKIDSLVDRFFTHVIATKLKGKQHE